MLLDATGLSFRGQEIFFGSCILLLTGFCVLCIFRLFEFEWTLAGMSKKQISIKRWHLFGAAFIVIGVLPLLPIIFELQITGFPKLGTTLVIAAIYSVAIGTIPESNPLFVVLGALSCTIWSVEFAIVLANPKTKLIDSLTPAMIFALLTILVWLIIAFYLLLKSYFKEGKKLWGIKVPS